MIHFFYLVFETSYFSSIWSNILLKLSYELFEFPGLFILNCISVWLLSRECLLYLLLSAYLFPMKQKLWKHQSESKEQQYEAFYVSSTWTTHTFQVLPFMLSLPQWPCHSLPQAKNIYVWTSFGNLLCIRQWGFCNEKFSVQNRTKNINLAIIYLKCNLNIMLGYSKR